MADDGFALAWTAVPTVGKRVFLHAVSTIPTVMHRMTPSVATVKKAAYGRSKSPAFAGAKTATDRGPSPNPPESPSPSLPKGRELIPAEFKDVGVLLLPLGRALKNYRYFHFIGVVRRHYRAFTRRSGNDVW